MLECICNKKSSSGCVVHKHLTASCRDLAHHLPHTGFRLPLLNHSLARILHFFNVTHLFLVYKNYGYCVLFWLCMPVCVSTLDISLDYSRCVGVGRFFCRSYTPFHLESASSWGKCDFCTFLRVLQIGGR